MASTGWTWDYIGDHLDLPRLAALNKYWRLYPPVHLLVAGYLNYHPSEPIAPAAGTDQTAGIMDDLLNG